MKLRLFISLCYKCLNVQLLIFLAVRLQIPLIPLSQMKVTCTSYSNIKVSDSLTDIEIHIKCNCLYTSNCIYNFWNEFLINDDLITVQLLVIDGIPLAMAQALSRRN